MPGKQVKNWSLYHKLRKKGYSKEKSARIANSSVKKRTRTYRYKGKKRKR